MTSEINNAASVTSQNTSSATSDQPGSQTSSLGSKKPAEELSEKSSDNASKSQKDGEVNIEDGELKETSEMLNKAAEALKRDMRFQVVPSEGIIQAQIVNRENEEIIKEIPPDELIEIRKRIDTFLGIFVDEER